MANAQPAGSPTPTPTRTTPLSPGQWLLVAFALACLFGVQLWATHAFYTTLVPGGNDYYPRWYGGNQLATEGRNPYSDSITDEISAVLDPLQQRTNSFNFAFPLHVLFFMVPTIWLPYAWAQAWWMVTIIWLAVGCVLLLLYGLRTQPPPVAAVLLLLLTLTAYPVARTLFLGQFTLHVTICLLGALVLLQRERDFAAGALFAIASIKPQMVVLIAPWLLLWALGTGRLRFVTGLLTSGGVMFIASLIWLPSWPLDFFNGLFDYAAVAGGRNALELIVDLTVPAASAWLPTGLALLLLGLLAWRCWQFWRQRHTTPATTTYLLHPALEEGVAWAIVVTLLVPFQTGTTNQVLLLIPFGIWAVAWANQRAGWQPLLTLFALSSGLWWLFSQTLQVAKESELMFLPLPLLALAILCWRWWRDARPRVPASL